MPDILWGSAGDWSGGVDAFAAANFNALANNGGILSTATAIDNSTARRMIARLSFICVTSTWAVSAGGHLAFHLLRVAHDGSTYPNSNNGTGAGDYPGGHNLKAIIGFRAATLAHVGVSNEFQIPPGVFKLFCINRTGAALPSSGTNMTCEIETLNEAVV